ncbi:1-deoxy-D-xylulose-5-phosphate synthase [Posidoniimonas corsicana]|uniref:1-deoxy-D-xylulose-5-phosphate synthase n=1 Tax=Posidoniimonas corsicana TaxID=1938618 RepID=A0A5C5VCA6_9BACT|nr:transketolase C-terminal domain-containing protein [Posidoniimonas corsicana]TWT35245.1 1-deoxy-D-xylulose-5-phosphate synthase [Posidoniimonas corsicana]
MSASAPELFSPAATDLIEQHGYSIGQPNLVAFAETLLELARANSNILAVTSDSRGSGKISGLGVELPNQIVEVGIAEQNLVGVSAGLASCGKVVYAVSPSCFLTARALEQIKNDVCYSDNPVKLIGISAGVSYGALGTTHHSLHDLSALRAINNIDIVVPADNFETQQVIRQAAERTSPIYIRFGKAPMVTLPRVQPGFQIGEASVIRDGGDVAFIATGETVVHCLLAADKLVDQGLNCRVISMHTVKPLDKDALFEAADRCQAIVTVEEHMVNGGLGEACARMLLESGRHTPFRAVGIPDEYTVTGSQSDIFRHYGISMEGLVQTATQLLERVH